MRDKHDKPIEIGSRVKTESGVEFSVQGAATAVHIARASDVEVVSASSPSAKSESDTVIWGS